MKYIITESKLEKTIINYLNEMYGDLEQYTTDEYPYSVFYVKDNKVYMEQDLTFGNLFINYFTIWKDLRTIFSLEDEDISRIITKWVEETYKLRGFTPDKDFSDILFGVEERDRKSTRLNSSHSQQSRMPSSA